MRKRIVAAMLAAGLSITSFTACGTEDIKSAVTSVLSVSEEDEAELEETADTGVDINNLQTDEFYVLHNDTYYPAWMAYANYKQEEEPDDFVSSDSSRRQLYYSTEDEKNIPTLYLNKGDKLIFYKDTDVIDYITFERYKDLGYTIPVYDIRSTSGNARFYVNLSDENGCLLPSSDLYQMKNDILDGNNVTLSNLGRVDITEDIVRSTIHYEGVDEYNLPYEDIDIAAKLIEGCVKGETYDLEVYDGTNYHHYLANCDMHAFEQFEIFKSTDFTPLKANTWEVDIPDYLTTGYYRLFAKSVETSTYTGLVRIIVGQDTFDINDKDSFNDPLLILSDTDLDSSKGVYSTTEELNTWSSYSAAPNSLGYVTDDIALDSNQVNNNKIKMREASVQKYNLTFTKDADCKIVVTPKKTDATGDIYVLMGDTLKPFVYDRIYNTYTLDLKGDGNCYTLVVSGLWNSYNIDLTNVKRTEDTKSLSVFPDTLAKVLSLDEYAAGQTGVKTETPEATNEYSEMLKNSKLDSNVTAIISLKDAQDAARVYMVVTHKDETTEVVDFTKNEEGNFEYTFPEDYDKDATYEIKSPVAEFKIDYK